MNATCDNDIIQVDERELEGVMPNIGKDVMIVHGRYRGRRGELLDVNYDKYVCSVRIVDGEESGSSSLLVDSLEYEDTCKAKEGNAMQCSWLHNPLILLFLPLHLL
jgi:hypothetical protein